MKVRRNPSVSTFRPFSIDLEFERANDVQLFLCFLNKLEKEVKHGGIYYDIICQLRLAAESP